MTLANDKVITLPFLHQNKPDRPNTVFPSTLAFKQALDSSTVAIQTAHNATIDDLLSIAPGTSGAEQIGSAPILGVNGITPYAQIADLKAQIQTIVGGSLPPGGITLPFVGSDVKNMISMGGLF